MTGVEQSRRWKRTASVLAVIAVLLGMVLVWRINQAPGHLRLFQGVKVAFLSGSEEHPFSDLLRRGVDDAAKDLGCAVTILNTGWDPKRMLSELDTAIDGGFDGICVLGHPGADALRPLVERAVARGVVITCQNVDVPTLRSEYHNSGFGYVGNDQVASGMAMADGCVRLFHLESGDRAVVITTTKSLQSERIRRPQAVVERLKGTGVAAELLLRPIPSDLANAESAPLIAALHAELRAMREVRVIVCDSPTLAVALTPLIDELPQLKIACFDLTPKVISALRAGRIHLVGDQLPYVQGYLPVLQVCLSVRGNFSGMHVDTGLQLIDRGVLERLSTYIADGRR